MTLVPPNTLSEPAAQKNPAVQSAHVAEPSTRPCLNTIEIGPTQTKYQLDTDGQHKKDGRASRHALRTRQRMKQPSARERGETCLTRQKLSPRCVVETLARIAQRNMAIARGHTTRRAASPVAVALRMVAIRSTILSSILISRAEVWRSARKRKKTGWEKTKTGVVFTDRRSTAHAITEDTSGN